MKEGTRPSARTENDWYERPTTGHGEFHRSRYLMKNIAVGRRTFSESSNGRGDFHKMRLSNSRSPRGFCADGLRTETWAARFTHVRKATVEADHQLTRSSALTLRKSTPTHESHGQ